MPGSSYDRHYSPLDQTLIRADRMLKSLLTGVTHFGPTASQDGGKYAADKPQRPNPAGQPAAADPLSETERAHAAGLMRVNHTGEVCAQALYQSQAVTARSETIRDAMERAAREEVDHLRWCEQRLTELDSHRSRLNPLWYAGSFAIGGLAGLAGDRWNLGFVAETERQVVRHLESHLRKLPAQDRRSRAIVEQMKIDEAEHATLAVEAGAAELPAPVKGLMRLTAKFMTTVAYRI